MYHLFFFSFLKLFLLRSKSSFALCFFFVYNIFDGMSMPIPDQQYVTTKKKSVIGSFRVLQCKAYLSDFDDTLQLKVISSKEAFGIKALTLISYNIFIL